jgi:hypothetical protein
MPAIESEMMTLTNRQLGILRDIDQAIAFDDDLQGEVERLIIESYVVKQGDLYELTAAGEKALLDNAASLMGDASGPRQS